MTKYAEVRHDHTDDENLTYIDTWKTGDDEEGGTVVAVVCRDTGKVIFTDNGERVNPQVIEAISEVLKELKDSGEVEPPFRYGYFKNSCETFIKK